MAGPGIGIDQSPFREMARRARQMGARDIPGAVVAALNETATQAKADQKGAMATVFDRPTTFTANSIFMSRAKLADGENAQSKIFVAPRLVDILLRQEVGGTAKGLAFAQPSFENRYGSLTPRQIHRLSLRKNFFYTTIGTTRGLWKRLPNHRLQLVVSQVAQGRYRPRFGFMDRSRATGERVLGPALQRELNARLSAPPGAAP